VRLSEDFGFFLFSVGLIGVFFYWLMCLWWLIVFRLIYILLDCDLAIIGDDSWSRCDAVKCGWM